MEIKLTADKKLLDAINHLAEAILASRTSAPESEDRPDEPAPVSKGKPDEPRPERKIVPMPEPEPTPERKEEPAPVTREEVRSLATSRIQDGKRDELKALLAKYNAKRVSDVAEDKLAAFAAEMEAL